MGAARPHRGATAESHPGASLVSAVASPARQYRLAPRPAVGVAVLALYLTAFYGVWILTDVDYERIGDTASTVVRWYVAPLAAGAVVLVASTTWLGWWRPALREDHRTGPRWLVLAPSYMVGVSLLMLATKDYDSTTATMVVWLVVGSAGVGFCEELVTRGVLLTGLRGGMGETGAWFLSCLLFGLLHLPNWWFGAGPAAVLQVVLAFGAGSMLYVVRRWSGTLVVAMLVHGFWDFSSFVGGDPSALLTPLVLLNSVLGVVLGLVVVRHGRASSRPSTP